MGIALAVRTGARAAEELAAWSRAALDVPLAMPELWVHEVSTPARVLGAFERGPGVGEGPLVRRGSGGPMVLVGPGTVHVALLLAHPSQLVACEPGKLVNRYVRPLLRALTRVGATAHYFGRDWVSVMQRPAAWVGFAHDAGSRRTLIEAFVPVSAPFATHPRASFLGKEPGTLEGIVGKSISTGKVIDTVVDAFAAAYGCDPASAAAMPAPREDSDPDPSGDPPWSATAEEIIGTLGAGPDRHGALRLGGALLASRDAVSEVETRASAIGPDEGELGRMVDAVFRAPGVALDGVRSLHTVRNVLREALSKRGPG